MKIQKIITGFIILVLFAPQAMAQVAFTDLSSNHPYYEAISYLYENGIVEGYDDGSFRPDQRVNRAEALKILLLGSNILVPDIQPQEVFPDVTHGVWYAKYVSKAKNLGIVSGDDTTGYFRPGDTVNLAEALKILLNTNNVTTLAPSNHPYADVPPEAWFAPYFQYAKKVNLLDQSSGENVYPATPVTRGLLAELMFRLATKPLAQADGKASYYANFFHGRTTASGETYDQSLMTAAHREFPFNTWLRVTNVENGKSVIVRVNDRGPYADTANRIIDLSKAAFEKIAPLSRGVINVKVEKVSGPNADTAAESVQPEPVAESQPEADISIVPADLNGVAAKCPGINDVRYIPQTVYDGFTLDSELPDRFLTSEVLTLSGSTTASSDTITAFLVLPSGKQKVYYGKVNAGRFLVNVRFGESGNMQLGLIPSDTGTSVVQDVSVYNDNCVAERESADLAPPNNIDILLEEGDSVIRWDGDYDVYKLTLSQGGIKKSFIVHSANEWTPYYPDFKDFSEGLVSLSVRGGNIASKSLLEASVFNWSLPAETGFTATTHHAYSIKKDDVNVLSIAKNAIKGSSIQATIQPKISIRSKAAIILPSGYVKDVMLSSATQPIKDGNGVEVFPPSNHNLIFSYTTNESGTHFLEINGADGLAVINIPLYPKSKFPLVPDMNDLAPEAAVDLGNDLTALRIKWLGLINKDRGDLGILPIVLDNDLTDLAQSKSDDMARNNYFGHWNAQGLSTNDLKANFGIQQTVAENLAQDVTIEQAQFGLMSSAIHRSNILSEDWTRVGLGISKTPDGSYKFVQLFSEDSIDLSDLNLLRQQILNSVNENRSVNLYSQNNLNDLAQAWSTDMADRDFFDFTNPDGRNLVNVIRDAGVESSVGTYIMGNSSFGDALVQVSNNAQIQESRWKSIGVGIKQDNLGIIKITLIYSE